MRKSLYIGTGSVLALCGVGAALWISRGDAADQHRYELKEEQVVIANPARLPVRLFRSGQDLASAQEVAGLGGSSIDLARGNFFLNNDLGFRVVARLL